MFTNPNPTLVSFCLRAFSLLPLGMARWLGRLIGRVNYYMDTRSAKVTRENLALCYPELSTLAVDILAKQSLIQTGQTATETPAVWLSSLARARRWISRVENENLLDEAQNKGKGVIVLLPHLGNWEMFNVYFATRGKMTALYQPPRQVALQPLMREIREKMGNELVPTNVKGLARLYRCLQEGKVVTILPDQVPASGKYAAFFGHQVLTDVLISRLLKKTGATAVCCTVRREKSNFVVTFTEPDEAIYSTDIEQSLAGMNLTIERAVHGCVEQYQWEYKRFRERPAGEKKLYKYLGAPDVYHD